MARQSFLLSAASRTISLLDVANLTEDEAYSKFKAARFAVTGGKPVCPSCNCNAVYEYKVRKIFKCKKCEKQFSATSGTIFASRKLSFRKILFSMLSFVNGANGNAALRLARDMQVDPQTAFVLCHKLREVFGTSRDPAPLRGIVEIDGAFLSRHRRPYNIQKNNAIMIKKEKAEKERRKAWINERLVAAKRGVVLADPPEQPPEWKSRRKCPRYRNEPGKICVFVMRERGGRALPFVVKNEADGLEYALAHIDPSATIYADESPAWNDLHGKFKVGRVAHASGYSLNGVSTNQAESFFSRLRRANRGVHIHLSHQYLQNYADELAWRENNRLKSNGEQFRLTLCAAANHPVSRRWKGWWQQRNSNQVNA